MAKNKLEKILEVVVYLKDKIDNDMVTQKQFIEKNDDVLTHIDGFIKLPARPTQLSKYFSA